VLFFGLIPPYLRPLIVGLPLGFPNILPPEVWSAWSILLLKATKRTLLRLQTCAVLRKARALGSARGLVTVRITALRLG
jgi:hypothetical protein